MLYTMNSCTSMGVARMTSTYTVARNLATLKLDSRQMASTRARMKPNSTVSADRDNVQIMPCLIRSMYSNAF